MIKKIIERIFKVVNIMVNILIGFIAIGQLCNYGIDGYMFTDSIYRLVWIVVMFIIINICDILIRRRIREF